MWRWFGHVERMGDGNWVKRIRSMNVEGVSARERLKKTWNEVIQKDLRDMGLIGGCQRLSSKESCH